MEENRCIICGKLLHDPLAVYCTECEYELKRARLADEETVEEWLEKVKEERITHPPPKGLKSLDLWLSQTP